MCVKLPFGNLNLNPCPLHLTSTFTFGNLNLSLCPLHPTSTFTCKVTIAPRVCGDLTGSNLITLILFLSFNILDIP